MINTAYGHTSCNNWKLVFIPLSLYIDTTWALWHNAHTNLLSILHQNKYIWTLKSLAVIHLRIIIFHINDITTKTQTSFKHK